MQDTRDALMIGRSSDGRLVRRPLSPHLQVYRLPVAGVMSISHRITGVVLSAGAVLLVWWLAAAASSDRAYATVSAVLRNPLGLLVLAGWTACLWYHFCNGIRHLAWDAGYGFEVPAVRRANLIVLGASAVLTLLTWVAIAVVL